MAQVAQQGPGLRAGLLGAREQDVLDAARIGNQRVVALAHRRDHAVHALEQDLLGLAPGDAFGELPAQRLGFRVGGECPVDLEQGGALGVLGFAGRARVGLDAVDQPAQLLARREERDRVVVALAHLAAVQPGQRRHVLVHRRLGQHEMLAVEVVEARRDVARHLDVLHLVASHGHLVRLEGQDVGGHQHRVHEEAGRHAVVQLPARGLVLVLRGLVGMGPVEQALAGHARQQPVQLRDLGDVGLPVERDVLRVQPRRQPARGDLHRGALDARRVFALDERVVVRQEVEALHAGPLAGRHRGADRADEVAQVGRARGRDAGEKARGAHGRIGSGPKGERKEERRAAARPAGAAPAQPSRAVSGVSSRLMAE